MNRPFTMYFEAADDLVNTLQQALDKNELSHPTGRG